VSQSIRELLQTEKLARDPGQEPLTVWNAASMFDVACVLGATVRRVSRDDGDALQKAGIEFNPSLILGGQIKGEAMRMFMVYPAGNFIEATRETCYFQIGESKYGKPVLDRLIVPTLPLDTAAKCALVSMDSTIHANLSVGLPLDLLLYHDGALQSNHIVCVDEGNPYFQMIRTTWAQRLREVFDGMEDPCWEGGNTGYPIRTPSERYEPMRKISNPAEKIV
jgi:putative proteasome-type protease